eukprot:s872_g4.t1
MWGNVSKSYTQQQRQDEIQRNRYKPLLKSTLTSRSSKQASKTPKRQWHSAKTVTKWCLKRDTDGKSNRRKLTGSATSASSIRSSLPKHRQLKALRVQDVTLVKYKSCVEQFLATCAKRRWSLRNVQLADKHMSEYFAELCEEGCTYNLASYTLFGYLMLQTDEPTADKNLFPQARAALKGWSSRFPQCSRSGADPLIWFLLANHIADHNPMAAAALLIQLDSYARPSEILHVKKRDVITPTSKTCKYWGIIFGNSEFGELTKTKQQDDTVLLDSLDRTYAPKVLQMVFKKCRQRNQLIFGSISLREYENLFKQARKDAVLAQFDFTPHCVRHSGPSCDFLQRARTATEIQTRGRWGTQKAILRYQKPGQMLARMRKIPQDVWDKAEKALPLVMQKLQRHFSG